MRNNLQKGLCNCGGFLQYDKESDTVFCKSNCGFHIGADDFEELLEQAHEEEYQVHDEEQSLNYLNNL